MATGIKDTVRSLLGNPGLEPGNALKSGIGFPTSLCPNYEVVYYTPNPGRKDVVLEHQDVMRVDFGVHINGWIVDSAFTIAFNPTYNTIS
jgi:methionyl aminopeptidase